MDKELYDLLDNMTADELMPADELLEELAENTALPEDIGSRIRSSVLRKAGFEMNNTIKMTKGNDINNIDSGNMSIVRRGHRTVAACAALAIVAAATGVILFGNKLNVSEPKSPLSQMQSAAEGTEEQTDVPNVVGLDEEQAKQALEEAGFVPVRCSAYDLTEEGKVIDTEPVHGTMLTKGSEVRYVVSRGELDPYKVDESELYDTACGLYDDVMVYHGDTIDRFNANNGTKFALEKPSEDDKTEYLRELCSRYMSLLGLSGDEMYDYIMKSYMTDEAEVPDLIGLSDEEAKTKLEDAGFVPVRVEVFSFYYPEGTVCDQEYYPDMVPIPESGSEVRYYVSKGERPDSYDDIPDFNKVLFEDDGVIVTADKMICDGSYFVMHIKAETKDGSPIKDFTDNWYIRLRYAEDGERVPYISGWIDSKGSDDSSVGEGTVNWVLDDTAEGKEMTLDFIRREDTAKYRSDESTDCTRESFRFENNVPTRILTSENGTFVTLSPMGISWRTKLEGFVDMDPDNPITSQHFYVITKDGDRVIDEEYFRCAELCGVNTGAMQGMCFCAYKDIGNIDSIEIDGVIFK